MNTTMNLYRMQTRQREHDVRFHPDIYGGEVNHRVAHYCYHYAKYLGRIAALLKQQPDELAWRETLKKILTDAFIITLAASDALNIEFEEPKERMVQEQFPLRKATEDLLYDFAIAQSIIAKALDSHDHMESYAIGDELRKGTREVMRVLLVTADRVGLNLESTTFLRWKEVEAKRIL
ncbi:MAG TPA: hypothetical protein VLJ21_00620 [Candidatus Binatia bacterium]|nr:hypothetical protein [Candidatus Binatia bacterium]